MTAFYSQSNLSPVPFLLSNMHENKKKNLQVKKILQKSCKNLSEFVLPFFLPKQ